MSDVKKAMLVYKQKKAIFDSFRVGEKVGVFSEDTNLRNPNTDGARHAKVIYKNNHYLTVEFKTFNDYTHTFNTWRESFCVVDIDKVKHLGARGCYA